MGCCIQSSLAKIVADFEIALEQHVLQPLNKLSEVVLAALLAPLFNLTLLPVSPGLPHSPRPSLPQEELPIILKRKKTLQRLISDWNTIKSRYGAHCSSGEPGWTEHSPQTGWGREEGVNSQQPFRSTQLAPLCGCILLWAQMLIPQLQRKGQLC